MVSSPMYSDVDMREVLSDSVLRLQSSVRYASAATTPGSNHVSGVPLVLKLRGNEPKWFADAVTVLAGLVALPSNWDSYGARRINSATIQYSIQLLWALVDYFTSLPRPNVVPTPQGGVQFEWHLSHADLEVEVLAPGRVDVAFEHYSRGVEWEAELTSDLNRLLQAVAELVAPANK